jgi:peptidoglycan L-alanyl-D-glutamate endopeptidase CwlK
MVKAVASLVAVSVMLFLSPFPTTGPAAEPRGTLDDPIIDSAMTEAEAFAGLDPQCPDTVRHRQTLVIVRYYSFDKRVHTGQVVVDKDLVGDIKDVFGLILKSQFPIKTAIPISHPRFRRNGAWDDELSMEANNTSAFNYRVIAGTTRLSNHAYGRAIDINPLLNPYIKDMRTSPKGAKYDPAVEGTLTTKHAVVQRFLKLGWSWGGDWDNRKDYQHFEKPSASR